MQAINSILVVIDPIQEQHLAVERAQLIAETVSAKLILVAPNPKLDRSSQAMMVSLSHQLEARGIDCEAFEEWHGDTLESILHTRRVHQCDLIIKETGQDITQHLLPPLDCKLLRHSEVPVLQVKHSEPWHGGDILAPIEANPKDSDHKMLNEVILKHARDIAQATHAKLHIVSAYPIPVLASATANAQALEALEQEYTEHCQALAAEYGITPAGIHIDKGLAEELIAELAGRLNVRLIVMGTVARTGLKGALIGNTAEQILDSIDTDVLTLKPVDYMAPIERILT